eukprot:8638485-Lingulodinium_polyedra.AAC.1
MHEVQELTRTMSAANVIALKDLRRYAGKCNHLASIIMVWRPFLAALWAAVTDHGPSNAPRGCVWRAQLDCTLAWIRAFLDGTAGALQR